MLKLEIGGEFFDEHKQEFIYQKPQILKLEHSLIAISKWESKYHEPFLNVEKLSNEQLRYYIECMTVSRDMDPKVYELLTDEHYKQINDYIDDPMTATTIRNNSNNRSREIITSEIIYYWMVDYRIPVEFEKWHINRLLTLIRVITAKNTPAKKMSKGEIMARNRALNEQRRKASNTRG